MNTQIGLLITFKSDVFGDYFGDWSAVAGGYSDRWFSRIATVSLEMSAILSFTISRYGIQY
jgi:hypothetical protein